MQGTLLSDLARWQRDKLEQISEQARAALQSMPSPISASWENFSMGLLGVIVNTLPQYETTIRETWAFDAHTRVFYFEIEKEIHIMIDPKSIDPDINSLSFVRAVWRIDPAKKIYSEIDRLKSSIHVWEHALDRIL